ncbi:hypothetical protein GNIT_1359 [Glaciecola nitratireducens FR1064]|uniref:Uncharacterized protein n=1 Tax=Glaciecola nitratireducens (strain JCM 12485 / KCTC 12276 / FR1064) TaxID=1085623 RepID=G4QGF8_GLANF|nr:hypothetical protein GNIT_1359 [Glaciecola nitratireducens FR1064]
MTLQIDNVVNHKTLTYRLYLAKLLLRGDILQSGQGLILARAEGKYL